MKDLLSKDWKTPVRQITVLLSPVSEGTSFEEL